MKKIKAALHICLCIVLIVGCDKNDPAPDPTFSGPFYFGADLSYVNHILDKGGVYNDNGGAKDPYEIFHDHGTNLVRLRLWHNPVWTKEVYGGAGTQLYNDLYDVEKSIRSAKDLGMEVLLDFHYSDTWADPGNQKIPTAWIDIKELSVLEDSVYNYTHKVLSYLNAKGLMPELVQIGNETNCGMLYTDAPTGFPAGNGCNEEWVNLRSIINSGIQAVHDVSLETKIILHIADPKSVEWWFDKLTSGATIEYDIIGISYYPIWHTTVTLPNLSQSISAFRAKYGKDVMVLETAYPWTSEGNDNYNNIFGSQTHLTGYPFSKQGQEDILIKITQEVIDGGGIGVIYWEPAWITSQMKDLWGTGSSWENTTFFDFEGNVIQGMNFMQHTYRE